MTEEDYKSALSQVDLLSDAEEGTAELDRLDGRVSASTLTAASSSYSLPT